MIISVDFFQYIRIVMIYGSFTCIVTEAKTSANCFAVVQNSNASPMSILYPWM